MVYDINMNLIFLNIQKITQHTSSYKCYTIKNRKYVQKFSYIFFWTSQRIIIQMQVHTSDKSQKLVLIAYSLD